MHWYCRGKLYSPFIIIQGGIRFYDAALDDIGSEFGSRSWLMQKIWFRPVIKDLFVGRLKQWQACPWCFLYKALARCCSASIDETNQLRSNNWDFSILLWGGASNWLTSWPSRTRPCRGWWSRRCTRPRCRQGRLTRPSCRDRPPSRRWKCTVRN